MDLQGRPAGPADLPALVELQRSWDARWLGAPEHDESEVRESFERVDPLEKRSLVLYDGERVAAAAWWGPDESTLLVNPADESPQVYGGLVDWYAGSGASEAEVLARDGQMGAALEKHGWQHWLSQFELLRDAEAVPEPSWPAGVTVTSLDDHADAAFRVIYDEAAWAEVPGHSPREYAQWREIFVAPEDPAQQVLAWDGERLVGVALGKIFSDGTGWISQVAVPRDQQGRGLGSALIAEAFRRRVVAGATALGLGVSAANADALRLYQRLGLTIDREWMRYRPT